MTEGVTSFWDDEDTQSFLTAIVSLESMSEARMFLRDLLTEPEIKELAKRWKAARMLNEGVPYTRIERETGLSSATIARVSKWLREGLGGYRMMLEKVAALDGASSPDSPSTPHHKDHS